MSNNNPQTNEPTTATAARSQSQAGPEYINATGLNRFANWIDSELDNLLAVHADWQTAQSNRKYFGR